MIRRERKAKGRSRAGALIELDVTAVANGGHCVARHEGRVVFVRHALPGERVRATITQGGADDTYWRADAVEIVTASPERVRPPCRYARPGGCGGCDWQHASLSAQRSLKAAVISEQFRQLAGLEVDVEVEAVPGDDDGLGWRSRVRFAIDSDGRAGLRRHRSSSIQPIDACLIACPEVESVQVERHRWPGVDAVEVIASSTGERMVVLSQQESSEPDTDAKPAASESVVAIPPIDPDVSVVVAAGSSVSKVRGRKRLTERAAGMDWRVTGSGFWQVHPGASEVLSGAVVDALRPQPGEAAVDLYSGVGLFAGVLARQVGESGEVVAVESDRRAVIDARRNLHGCEQVHLVEGRVEKVLGSDQSWRCDVLVLDPPRAGAGRAVCGAIAELRPRAIAYVACDPASLARDVATFMSLGYTLAGLRAFDLFPMTHHVECVVVLKPADRPDQ